MAETLAASDNLEATKYKSGQVHVYEVDENGKKTHISHDQALKDRGYDPTDSAANYALRNQEQSSGNPEIDALRQEMREMEANNERRHQELLAVLQALVEKLNNNGGNGGQDPSNPNLPPGARVGPPEDEGMDRMRTHFSMLDGDEDGEEPKEPGEPPPGERLEQAETALAEACDELVIYTIRRRARAGDGLTDNRREDKEFYDKAMADYNEAIASYLQALGEYFLAENPEITEAEIQRQQLIAGYEEQIKFKEAEHSKNEDLLNEEVEAGGWRKFKARVLRRWANYSTTRKILTGAVIGGGAALASGTLGLGLAAIVAGTVAKSSLGLLSRSASARNISQKSYEREVANIERELQRSLLEFDRQVAAGNVPDSDNFAAVQADRVEYGLDKDVSRSQWRNRAGNALLILGAGSTAYGIAHLAGDHLPDFRLWPSGPGQHAHEFSMKGLGADQIHAKDPNQFQHGVLGLLRREGVVVKGATPERIHEMSRWMDTHDIASGMAQGPGHLEQNIVNFPRIGHEFANAHASAEQGFKIGADGTGTRAFHEWIKHAQSIGMDFERVKK